MNKGSWIHTFQSSFTCFEDFLYGDTERDTFALAYDCLVGGGTIDKN